MKNHSENNLSNNNKSFQKKLYLVLSIGIFCLAIITAAISSWLNIKTINEIEISASLQHVANAAQQSRLALLYDSSENALAPSESILAYPGIIHLAIYKPDLSILYESGKQITPHALYQKDIENLTNATLLNEDKIEWHFLAPVYLFGENIPNTADEYSRLTKPVNRIIGYVYIAADKTRLNQVRITSLQTNFGIAVLIAIILILNMKRVFTHFFSPLNALADVMQRSTAGELILYSGVKDPSEITKISTAYNKLVNEVIERDNKLTKHNLMLESIVSMRTQELIAARDVAIANGKLKTQFMANTTHELRTPLQSIIGYAEASIETALEENNPVIIKDMENILYSAQHLLTLINDILDFTRMEAGEMAVLTEDIELDELISHICKMIQPMLSDNCSLLVENHTDLVAIRTDRVKLTQILLNLLSNAAKFTESGTITLMLEHVSSKLIIEVADTGIGISEQHQEAIFDPFQQADGSITRKYGGTGLGLAITRQFCELLQGSIEVSSTPGSGTRFVVTLPISGDYSSQMIV